MTENLLQKLEEKMMFLVADIEEARKEIERLSHENLTLNAERERHAKKLHDLVSLLDVVNHAQNDSQTTNSTTNLTSVKPVLVVNETVVG